MVLCCTHENKWTKHINNDSLPNLLMDSKSQQIYRVNCSSHFFCDILSCTLQILLTQDFRIFLGTHVFEFESHYNQLPNIHNSTSWVLFFSFLLLRHKWRNSLQRRKKSIIVHHQGDKGVWPHTWLWPSTNKASLLGLLYTPSNTSTSPNAHHYICLPQILSKHGRCFNCIGAAC